MKCPYCGHLEDKVIDSRGASDGEVIRRRREPFDRKKVLAGLIKACEKRPVSVEQLESLVEDLERDLLKRFEREVSSSEMGEWVMERLHRVDEVAYVRFASVYRQFKDINEFLHELRDLLDLKGRALQSTPQTVPKKTEPYRK